MQPMCRQNSSICILDNGRVSVPFNSAAFCSNEAIPAPTADVEPELPVPTLPVPLLKIDKPSRLRGLSSIGAVVVVRSRTRTSSWSAAAVILK